MKTLYDVFKYQSKQETTTECLRRDGWDWTVKCTKNANHMRQAPIAIRVSRGSALAQAASAVRSLKRSSLHQNFGRHRHQIKPNLHHPYPTTTGIRRHQPPETIARYIPPSRDTHI